MKSKPAQINSFPPPTSTQVKLSDVIKLILQFLQQNNLHQSFQTLQRQSKTCLNFADKTIVQSIISTSNWQRMFKLLNQVTLSQQTLFDLYELIVDDLIDRDAFEAAKYVLAQCINNSEIYGNFTVNKSIIEQNKQKILRLQYICQNPLQKAMYHKPPTQIRRENITSRIIKETHQQVQKSRLLTLITSALRFESSKGLIMPNLTYSLIDGKYKNIENQMQQMITKVDKILKYNEETRITAMKISNKGEFIALGGIDGLIQIYEPIQYTLDTATLKYQGDGWMLFHDNSIQHIIFNETDEILASTDSKNVIKIWNTYTGSLLRKIDHHSPVACICWGIDSSQLAVGYQNVQVYGIRGCNLLKEYLCGGQKSNMSQEYLIELAICSNNLNGNRVLTFGQTGTIRTFNFKTQEQTATININRNILNPNGLVTGDIVKVILIKNKNDEEIIHVCTTKYVICLNQKLEQLSRYEVNGSGDSIELVNISFSVNFIYQCIKKEKSTLKQKNDGQFVIQVRDIKTHRIVYSKQIQSSLRTMELHKYRNLLVTYGADQVLSFWRP